MPVSEQLDFVDACGWSDNNSILMVSGTSTSILLVASGFIRAGADALEGAKAAAVKLVKPSRDLQDCLQVQQGDERWLARQCHGR